MGMMWLQRYGSWCSLSELKVINKFGLTMVCSLRYSAEIGKVESKASEKNGAE